MKGTIDSPPAPARRAGDEAAPTAVLHDPREPVARLLRDLRTRPEGLTDREAERRLVAYGPNKLKRRRRSPWPHQLLQQLVHPLALLLWLAAGLATAGGAPVLAAAIVVVILLNALFAFVQERSTAPTSRRRR